MKRKRKNLHSFSLPFLFFGFKQRKGARREISPLVLPPNPHLSFTFVIPSKREENVNRELRSIFSCPSYFSFFSAFLPLSLSLSRSLAGLLISLSLSDLGLRPGNRSSLSIFVVVVLFVGGLQNRGRHARALLQKGDLVALKKKSRRREKKNKSSRAGVQTVAAAERGRSRRS